MKFMIDGGSHSPLPKARRWLMQYPDASRQLLQLLTAKTIDYLIAQVKAGAQVEFVYCPHTFHYSHDFTTPDVYLLCSFILISVCFENFLLMNVYIMDNLKSYANKSLMLVEELGQ